MSWWLQWNRIPLSSTRSWQALSFLLWQEAGCVQRAWCDAKPYISPSTARMFPGKDDGSLTLEIPWEQRTSVFASLDKQVGEARVKRRVGETMPTWTWQKTLSKTWVIGGKLSFTKANLVDSEGLTLGSHQLSRENGGAHPSVPRKTLPDCSCSEDELNWYNN